MIGTLNEGSLHAQLKEWYARPGDLVERPLDGYVIDLVRGDLLVEIQTGGFSPLRKKLVQLLETHPVRVVAPIACRRRIIKTNPDGEVLSSRMSPKHGRLEDIFDRLVSIPRLVLSTNFEIDVLLTVEDEYRMHEPGKAWRRKGWVVAGRALDRVEETRLLATVGDVLGMVPDEIPERFTTADLAECLGIRRRLAQQMAYCLREMEATRITGKIGNSLEYVRNL